MKKPRKYQGAEVSPLIVLASKQLVGDGDADQIALPLLIYFDGAKRGRGSVAAHRFLTTHLIIASAIATGTGLKAMHDQVIAAYAALTTAAERPTSELDLTTGEYKTIRTAIASYLHVLPQIEVGLMMFATGHAAKVLA